MILPPQSPRLFYFNFSSHFTEFTKKKEKAISEGNLDELHAACTELAVLYTNEDEFENAIKEYKVDLLQLFFTSGLSTQIFSLIQMNV